jgi:hypothetical protein
MTLADIECSKVGTSFSAFHSQPEACARAPQTCLRNQIKDFELSDKARIAAGKVPLYLLSQYTHGSEATVGVRVYVWMTAVLILILIC